MSIFDERKRTLSFFVYKKKNSKSFISIYIVLNFILYKNIKLYVVLFFLMAHYNLFNREYKGFRLVFLKPD